jgi:hypothetical protein
MYGIRDGAASSCGDAGAVYVFQKDFGGKNNWGQVYVCVYVYMCVYVCTCVCISERFWREK